MDALRATRRTHRNNHALLPILRIERIGRHFDSDTSDIVPKDELFTLLTLGVSSHRVNGGGMENDHRKGAASRLYRYKNSRRMPGGEE
jgi:hypothetical protein